MATQATPSTATCDGVEYSLIDSIARLKKAMTVEDLAERLNVSQRYVYDLVRERRVPHFRIGVSIRFDPKLIADWLRTTALTSI